MTDGQIDEHLAQVVAACEDLAPHRVYDETGAPPVGVFNLERWRDDLAAVLKFIYAQGRQPKALPVTTIRDGAKLSPNANHMVYLPYFGPIPAISYLIALKEKRLPTPIQFRIESYLTKSAADWRCWGVSTLRAPDRPADDQLRPYYDQGMPPPPAPYGRGRYGTVTLCVVWAISSDASDAAEVPVDAFWWIPRSNFDPRVWCSTALRDRPDNVMHALRRQATLPHDIDVHYSAGGMLEHLLSRLKLAVAATYSDDIFASCPWSGLMVLVCDRTVDVKKKLMPDAIWYGDDLDSLTVFRDAGYDVFARCEFESRGPLAPLDPDAQPKDLYIDGRPYDRDTLAGLAFRSGTDKPAAANRAIWTRVGAHGSTVIRATGKFEHKGAQIDGTLLALNRPGAPATWCTLADLSDEPALRRAVAAVRLDATRGDPFNPYAARVDNRYERVADAVNIKGAENAAAREVRARWPLLREQFRAMADTGRLPKPASRVAAFSGPAGSAPARPDNRRFKRHTGEWPGFVAGEGSQRLVGLTQNLSRGGMLLEGDGTIQAGDHVRYALDVDGSTLRGEGEVVRCSKRRSAHRLVCAVQFTPPLRRLPVLVDDAS